MQTYGPCGLSQSALALLPGPVDPVRLCGGLRPVGDRMSSRLPECVSKQLTVFDNHTHQSLSLQIPPSKRITVSKDQLPPRDQELHDSKYDEMADDAERQHALEEYKNKLLDSREWEAKLKTLRLEIKGLQHDFDVSEDNIKALQSVGQIIGEVLKQLDEERCECTCIT